ncbi:hypothetical protein [Natronoglycomyces albus]|uniref:Uncharacterized protein n=1 Tax=Natronoglycomyces albus TaxID=2811108 RepID=A0A895XNV6_9ACTN|nr:hypothetical protein [Natronoglycomyces albus]QSB06817.1 hypothetical protein JQS30_08000 [Natronoglycomyces albus]
MKTLPILNRLRRATELAPTPKARLRARGRIGRATTAFLAAATIVALSACTAGGAFAEDDTTTQDQPTGVALIGIPGLQWGDINPHDTPTLYDMAGSSAVASMSVRTIGAWTCPEAAWATIGTGNRAGGIGARTSDCFEQSTFSNPISLGGNWLLPDAVERVAVNDKYAYGSHVGALAESVTAARFEANEADLDGDSFDHTDICIAAIGSGAAVAAAGQEGHLDYWRDDLTSTAHAAAECPIVLIDPGVSIGMSPQSAHEVEYDASEAGEEHQPEAEDIDPIDEETIDEETQEQRQAAQRPAQAAVADAALNQALASLPDTFDIIVAGISDSHSPTSLHPLMYTGPTTNPGWASSPTTGRDGYVQIVDIAPTILRTVDIPLHPSMTGRGINSNNETLTAQEAIDGGISHTRAAQSVAAAMPNFFLTIAVAGIIAIIGATAIAIRGRDHTPGALLTFGLLTVASLPVAATAAGSIPWWHASTPRVALWALTIAFAIGCAAAASIAPVRKRRYGPALVISALTFTVIAADLIAGSALSLHTPMGYTAQVGARFAGMGNYAFGAFAAAAILLVALTPWKGRYLTYGAPTAAATACIVVAAPMWGRNVGGTVTLIATMVLLCLALFGKRLSIATTLIAGSASAGIIALIGFIDFLRPEEQQTHLGRFVGQILGGEAFLTILRKAAAAWSTVFNTPLTLLVAAGVIAIIWMWRHGALADLSRPQQAALTGLAAVAIIGFLVNDSGIAVPGFVAVVGVPLFMTTMLRTNAEEDTPHLELPLTEGLSGTARPQ